VRVAAISLVALVFGSGLAGAATSVGVKSGLRGVVMRGPIRPVCGVNDPCDAPASGVLLRFSRAGVVVARATTGSAGGYRVKLRAGRYVVTTSSTPRVGTGVTPSVVRVPRGRVAHVDFHIDTGIQ
jgi:hypothetical protein